MGEDKNSALKESSNQINTLTSHKHSQIVQIADLEQQKLELVKQGNIDKENLEAELKRRSNALQDASTEISFEHATNCKLRKEIEALSIDLESKLNENASVSSELEKLEKAIIENKIEKEEYSQAIIAKKAFEENYLILKSRESEKSKKLNEKEQDIKRLTLDLEAKSIDNMSVSTRLMIIQRELSDSKLRKEEVCTVEEYNKLIARFSILKDATKVAQDRVSEANYTAEECKRANENLKAKLEKTSEDIKNRDEKIRELNQLFMKKIYKKETDFVELSLALEGADAKVAKIYQIAHDRNQIIGKLQNEVEKKSEDIISLSKSIEKIIQNQRQHGIHEKKDYEIRCLNMNERADTHLENYQSTAEGESSNTTKFSGEALGMMIHQNQALKHQLCFATETMNKFGNRRHFDDEEWMPNLERKVDSLDANMCKVSIDKVHISNLEYNKPESAVSLNDKETTTDRDELNLERKLEASKKLTGILGLAILRKGSDISKKGVAFGMWKKFTWMKEENSILSDKEICC